MFRVYAGAVVVIAGVLGCAAAAEPGEVGTATDLGEGSSGGTTRGTDDGGSAGSGSSTGDAGTSVGTGSTTAATTTGDAGTTDGTTDAAGSSGDAGGSTGDGPAPNLLLNPSVEAWTDAAEVNSYPDDWTNCNSDGLGLEAVPDVCDGAPTVAADGSRYARAYSGEGLGQSIATVPGQSYTVSFSYAAVDNCYGGDPDSTWEVAVDGLVISTTPSDAGFRGWSTATVQFEAEAALTEVCFRKGPGTGGIDALSVFES